MRSAPGRGRGRGVCPAWGLWPRPRRASDDPTPTDTSGFHRPGRKTSFLKKKEKKSLLGSDGGGKREKTTNGFPNLKGSCVQDARVPFLNGGRPQNTGGLGRESGLGHSLAQPVGPKWGHLAISGDILGCHNWGGGGCYWHPVGRGRGFCLTPPSAQDGSRQKRVTQIKCQSCRGADCLLQASLPATFCSTPKRPFQRTEVAPQTSPTPISKSFPPQVSSNKSVWRDRGEKKTETLLETWNKDVLSIHQLLP